MKTTALLSLLCLFCTACGTATKMNYDGKPEESRTIAALKSLCTGAGVGITQEISIQGIITGNDLYGEFSKTLVVEDASGAISVAVDRTGLSDLYPFGYRVTIRCNGLALGEYGGKVLLGAALDGQYGVTRIAGDEAARYIKSEGPGTVPFEILHSFTELTPAHTDTHVCFEGVRFTAPGSWCDLDPETHRPVTTERMLADADGNTLPVRTSGECDYAKEPVPTGTGSLYGIVDCFNGKYSLRVTNHTVIFTASAMLPTACLSAGEYSVPRPTK